MPCAYCKTVNALCFWGPRREAAWKRPVLLAICIPVVFGLGWLVWHFGKRADALFFIAFAVFFIFVGALGILVGVRGCGACVARLLGEL